MTDKEGELIRHLIYQIYEKYTHCSINWRKFTLGVIILKKYKYQPYNAFIGYTNGTLNELRTKRGDYSRITEDPPPAAAFYLYQLKTTYNKKGVRKVRYLPKITGSRFKLHHFIRVLAHTYNVCKRKYTQLNIELLMLPYVCKRIPINNIEDIIKPYLTKYRLVPSGIFSMIPKYLTTTKQIRQMKESIPPPIPIHFNPMMIIIGRLISLGCLDTWDKLDHYTKKCVLNTRLQRGPYGAVWYNMPKKTYHGYQELSICNDSYLHQHVVDNFVSPMYEAQLVRIQYHKSNANEIGLHELCFGNSGARYSVYKDTIMYAWYNELIHLNFATRNSS